MNLASILFVFTLLVCIINCQNITEDVLNITITTESTTETIVNENNITTTEITTITEEDIGNSTDTTTENTTETTTTEPPDPGFDRGIFGGIYWRNQTDLHYFHGLIQEPKKYYYNDFILKDVENVTALDYYFLFGLSQLSSFDDKYTKVNYFYNQDQNITKFEFILLEDIWDCDPKVHSLCLENSEPVCLRNGSIYCLSQIKYAERCSYDDLTLNCINSTIPCITNCEDNFEEVELPCLATVILVDPFVDSHGMTVTRLGGGYVLVPALKETKYCLIAYTHPKRKL